jgi:hypothetical protein
MEVQKDNALRRKGARKSSKPSPPRFAPSSPLVDRETRHTPGVCTNHPIGALPVLFLQWNILRERDRFRFAFLPFLGRRFPKRISLELRLCHTRQVLVTLSVVARDLNLDLCRSTTPCPLFSLSPSPMHSRLGGCFRTL